MTGVAGANISWRPCWPLCIARQQWRKGEDARAEPSRQRPSVQTLLAGLEREQLQALLLHLVEQQPALADVVEAQVHRVRIEPAADVSAPQERRTPVDPNVFRRQVRTILRSLDRMRSSEAYWHVGAVVNEVRQVLEQAQGFAAAGDGLNALTILRTRGWSRMRCAPWREARAIPCWNGW